MTSVPGQAMRLSESHGILAPGCRADYIVCRGRRYSELLARPQVDRVVVRNGKAITAALPDYTELDYVPLAIKSGDVAVEEVTYDVNGIYTVNTRLGSKLAGKDLRNRHASAKNRSASASGGSQPRCHQPWLMPWSVFTFVVALFAFFSSYIINRILS